MSKIYRGYLRSKGKRPIESFKGDDTKLITYNTVRQGGTDFAGVLSDKVMFLDIDTSDETDLLLQILDGEGIPSNVLKTSKGAHFYFLTPGAILKNSIEWFSPIGIHVTTKLGIKNVCEPLKIEGVTRKWIRKTDDLVELPSFLYPIDKKKNHVLDIEEGSRNQELFNYILKLQGAGMDKSSIKQTIKIINKYVLSNPLDTGEINTILRDEAFLKESFFKGSVFDHSGFGDHLMKEDYVIRIFGKLHVYKNGIYSDDPEDLERAMIGKIKSLTTVKRKEVLNYLQLQAPTRYESSWKWIAFNNGILNIDDWELKPFDPQIIVKNKVPVDYVPGAKCHVVDDVLEKMADGDIKIKLLLEEIIGYTMLRSNRYDKMLIFTGKKSNGKSSFIKMLSNMLGRENYETLQLKDMADKFRPANLDGKLANFGDDISNQAIEDNSTLKTIVSGNEFTGEGKGGKPFTLKPYSTLIFSANEVPPIKGSTPAILKRLLIIRLTREFRPSDPDFNINIDEELSTPEAKERIVQIGVEGLKRLVSQNGFTKSENVNKELKQFEVDNDTVLSFLKDNPDLKIENESATDIYQTYMVWCYENGVSHEAKNWFSRKVCNELGLVTKQQRVDGKRKQMFKCQ